MPQLSEPFELKFFEMLSETIEISDFEAWVYDTKELENQLSADVFFALLSFDFRQDGAKYDLRKLVSNKIVDLGKYEKWNLLKLLNQALVRDDNLPYILMGFYDMYCAGYYFFDHLGMNYGLYVTVSNTRNGEKNSDKVISREKTRIINKFYPQIESDLKRAIRWIEEGQIVLSGNYEYLDHRSEREKKFSGLKRLKRKSSFFSIAKDLFFKPSIPKNNEYNK